MTACFLRGVVLCLAACSPAEVMTQQWTQFRGDGSGVAPGGAKPAGGWGKTAKPVWKTAVPGIGWSSPVFADGRIWVTSAVTKPATKEQIKERLKGRSFADIKTVVGSVEFHAICVELKSGKLIKDIVLFKTESPEPINPLNSYASPTPALGDGVVICHFGNYGTWCLDAANGKKLWSRKVVVDHSVGPGSSPFISKGQVILVCDGIDKQFVTSLDLKTGKERWKTDRPPMRATNGEMKKAYSTPRLIEVDGRAQLIVPGAQWVVSYEPTSGKELWRADIGNGFSVATMAAYTSKLVVCSTGYMEQKLFALDPTGTGDVTKTHIKWQSRNAPAIPSMVAARGMLFYVNKDGIMSCVEASTGKRLKRIRVGGNFSASPLLVGNMLYLCSRQGRLTVIECSKELRTLAHAELGDSVLASPAPVGDDILVRTKSHLIRLKGHW